MLVNGPYRQHTDKNHKRNFCSVLNIFLLFHEFHTKSMNIEHSNYFIELNFYLFFFSSPLLNSGFHLNSLIYVFLLHFFRFVEPSPLYDNNHYHEECLRCNSCGINLSGQNHKRARRFKNQILCDLHFADVALMECSDFMQQLRSFKPQSLGCAVARRKSSTTLIFPLPPQACSGEF